MATDQSGKKRGSMPKFTPQQVKDAMNRIDGETGTGAAPLSTGQMPYLSPETREKQARNRLNDPAPVIPRSFPPLPAPESGTELPRTDINPAGSPGRTSPTKRPPIKKKKPVADKPAPSPKPAEKTEKKPATEKAQPPSPQPDKDVSIPQMLDAFFAVQEFKATEIAKDSGKPLLNGAEFRTPLEFVSFAAHLSAGTTPAMPQATKPAPSPKPVVAKQTTPKSADKEPAKAETSGKPAAASAQPAPKMPPQARRPNKPENVPPGSGRTPLARVPIVPSTSKSWVERTRKPPEHGGDAPGKGGKSR